MEIPTTSAIETCPRCNGSDVVVCDEEDAEAWSDGHVEDDDDRPLPVGCPHLTGLTECRERNLTVPEDGVYALVLVN